MKKMPFLALPEYSRVPYMDSVRILTVTLNTPSTSTPSNSKKDFPENLPKLISVGGKCKQLNTTASINLNSIKSTLVWILSWIKICIDIEGFISLWGLVNKNMFFYNTVELDIYFKLGYFIMGTRKCSLMLQWNLMRMNITEHLSSCHSK